MSSLQKGKYRHYKGKLYEVIDIARHSETLEEMVVYRPLYTTDKADAATATATDLWVRPLRMFTENVEVDGVAVPRFALIK